MKKNMKKWWKRMKGKAAMALALCVLAGGFAEIRFPEVYASRQPEEVLKEAPEKEEVQQPETSNHPEEAKAEAPEQPEEAKAGVPGEPEEAKEEVQQPEAVKKEVPGEPEEAKAGVPGEPEEGKAEAPEQPEAVKKEVPGEPEEAKAEAQQQPEEAKVGVSGEAETDAVRRAQGAVDRTNDTEELKIKLEEMYVLNTDNGRLSYTTSTSGGNTVYDASAHSYYDIGAVKFKISFTVLKEHSSGRELKAGDYIIYRIPEGFGIGGNYTDGVIEFGRVPIAVYERSTDSFGQLLTFTFQESVNAGEAYNNIAGGMNLELDFDASSLEGKNKLVTLLPVRGAGEPGVQIKLPQEPTMADGIQKKGTYDSTSNTIVWDITIGTEAASKGISLNGLVAEDVIGEGQTYIPGSVVLKKTNGAPVPGSVAVTEAGNTISCTLQGADIKAPCVLQLKTAITKPQIEAGGNQTFSNEVTMKAPLDGTLQVGSKNHAQNSVDVTFGTRIAKHGKQIDSNTIHWTIEVNDASPRVHVYHGAVTDHLMPGLTYKAGTMTYQIEDGGIQTPEMADGTVTSWQDHKLLVTGDAAYGQDLKFYLASDTRSKYKIEFDTTVEEGFAGTTDGAGNVVVTNNASVEAELPYWNGTGPEYVKWDYGIPEVSCRFDSSTLKKEVAADEKTGILTWTIYPSTRTADYDYAEITDVIESKQQYIDGSAKVKKKNGMSDTAITPNYAGDSKKLTVTIPKSTDVLGDYVITYQTRALNYFTENNVTQNYTNTAVLDIVKGSDSVGHLEASADVSMKNPFLAKNTAQEYINHTPYFHYTIDVNSNGMSLQGVTVTDDLNDCQFTAKASGTADIGVSSDKWEFDQALCKTMKGSVEVPGKKPQVSGTAVSVNLGDISEKHTVHLYVKLKDSSKALLTDLTGPESLANKKIYSVNTVKAVSNEVKPLSGAAFEVTSRSAEKNVYLDNTLVAKKEAGYNQAEGSITWNVVINPNGGPLDSALLEDKLPKTAKYAADSVMLYQGIYNNGKLVKGDAAALQPMLEYSVDKEYRYMKADLSAFTEGTYILEYKTVVVDTSKQSLSNQVSVKSGEHSYGSATGTKELTGGNWGTLSTAGKLEITKYDASVGAAMPLSGAEFTVYSDAACSNPADLGETDSSGKLTFFGLEAGTGSGGTVYYCKETKVPSGGYVENDEIYEVLIKRGATKTLEVKNKRKEAEEVTKAEIVKQYSYQDSAGTAQVTAGFQSRFELYFYPYGSSNTSVKQLVSFTENSVGDYLYDAAGPVSLLKNNASDGKILFQGLPWGYYGLKETKAAEGFALYTGMKYFEIGYAEDTGDFTVTYYFNPADQSDKRIVNQSTSFFVKKLLEGTTSYLPGVKLQIGKKDADGTFRVAENPITGIPYEWSTEAAEEGTGHLIENLPAGEYLLHEGKEGTDLELAIAEDVPFTVEADGTLTQDARAVPEITMYNSKIALEVRKEDQFKDAVNGAGLTMTESNGDDSAGYNRTITTTDGTAIFENLVRGGVYKITETTVPDGYGKTEDVEIRISEDGRECYQVKAGGMPEKINGALVMVDRKLLVELKIGKTDSFSGKEIAGAEFALYRRSESPEVEDTKLLSDMRMTAQGTGEDAWLGFDIAHVPESISNPFTSKPLRKGLNAGNYYLRETKVPDGYKCAPEINFSITADGELQLSDTDAASISERSKELILVKDEPLTLRIEKQDAEDGNPLTGAEYDITGMFAGELSETVIALGTDASRQNNALSGKLLPGEVYKITETKAPAGYDRIEAVYVMLDASGAVTVTDDAGGTLPREDAVAVNLPDDKNGTDGILQIYDKKTHVNFIKRTSGDGSQIDGAVFTITGMFADKSTEKVLYPTADAAAELVGMLIDGEAYTLTEKAPAGYLPLAGSVSFCYNTETGLKLTEGSDSHLSVIHASPDTRETLVITNDSAQNTSLQFIKYDKEDNSGIPGTVFELAYIPEGSSVSQTSQYTVPDAGTVYEYVTAGETHRKVTVAGEAFFTGLGRGTYRLTEVAAGYGYELGEQPFSCTFTVDDRAKNKTIVINSTNADNCAFDLAVTAGEALLTGKGIVNERMSGSVTLKKVDALDKTKPLNEVGFTIYRYKESSDIIEWFRQLFTGKAYQVKTTGWTEQADADGMLTIQGLPWGRYYIVETSTLDHYVLDDTRYEFTIGKDKLSQVLDWTPGKEITNAKVQMTIQQITSGGEAAQGNRMRIYGKFANYTGEYIEWTVGKEPYVIAGELIENETYKLEEVSAYDGYTSAGTVTFRYSEAGISILEGEMDVEVSVAEDGSFQLVQKIKPIRVSIKKIDEEKKLLSGAKLRLDQIKADGSRELIEEWTSSGEEWKLEGILQAGGSYVLTEVEAPAGYELAADITFQAEDTTEWQYITMTDKKKEPEKEEPKDKEPGKEEPEDKEPGKEEPEDKEPGKEEPEDKEPGKEGQEENKKPEETPSGQPAAVLPKTGRENREVYYFAGICFVFAGILLCRQGRKKIKP